MVRCSLRAALPIRRLSAGCRRRPVQRLPEAPELASASNRPEGFVGFVGDSLDPRPNATYRILRETPQRHMVVWRRRRILKEGGHGEEGDKATSIWWIRDQLVLPAARTASSQSSAARRSRHLR